MELGSQYIQWFVAPEDRSSSTLQKELDPGTSPLRYCAILAVQTITLTLFFFL